MAEFISYLLPCLNNCLLTEYCTTQSQCNYSATEREMLQCTEIFDDPANDTIEAAAPQILGCVDADISSGVPQCLLTEYC